MRLGLERGLTLNLLFPRIQGTDVLFENHLFLWDQEFEFGVAADFWEACFVPCMTFLVDWGDLFPEELVATIVDCDMLVGNRVVVG